MELKNRATVTAYARRRAQLGRVCGARALKKVAALAARFRSPARRARYAGRKWMPSYRFALHLVTLLAATAVLPAVTSVCVCSGQNLRAQAVALGTADASVAEG